MTKQHTNQTFQQTKQVPQPPSASLSAPTSVAWESRHGGHVAAQTHPNQVQWQTQPQAPLPFGAQSPVQVWQGHHGAVNPQPQRALHQMSVPARLYPEIVPSPPKQSETAPTQLAQAPNAYLDAETALEIRILWGDTVLDHAHFHEVKSLTIGESKRNTFSISSDAIPEGLKSFPLIESQDGLLMVQTTDQMSGWLEHAGQRYDLAQLQAMQFARVTTLGHKFALPAKAKVFLQLGTITFSIAAVPATKSEVIAGGFQPDSKLGRALGASFLVHGLLVLLMLFSDELPTNIDETYKKIDDRFAGLILRPKEEKVEKKRAQKSGGAKAPKKEGSMGDRKSTKKRRRADQIEKNIDGTAPIDMKKSINEKQLLNSIMRKGLLGMLPGGKMSQSSILTAKGLGGGDVNALGSWNGSKAGNAFGNGGLGLLNGGGPGGGGLHGNIVATGNPDLLGRGNGKYGGRNWKDGGLKQKKKHKIKFETGHINVGGGLDRKIIRRHINMHRRHIKYCYEKELIKNKQLAGKIEVLFTIEPNGRVDQSKIARSTMNNDQVEICINQRIKHIRFPAPIGGGIVVVRYPFMFHGGR